MSCLLALSGRQHHLQGSGTKIRISQCSQRNRTIRISINICTYIEIEVYTHTCMLSHFSRVWFFVILWTIAHQALYMGILQARTLQWVAMTSSRGSSWPRDQTHISYISCTGRWVLCQLKACVCVYVCVCVRVCACVCACVRTPAGDPGEFMVYL